MSDLFSHASAAADSQEPRRDIVVAVSVPAPSDHAWAGLTEHLHLWWPADELSRWGADSFFDLEDNALVETSAEDDEYVWGEVLDGLPGQWLELRWRHVGSDSTSAVRLEMAGSGAPIVAVGPEDGTMEAAEDSSAHVLGRTFDEIAGMTLTITHAGWTSADPEDVYETYRTFWPKAAARYRRFMGGS